MKSPTQFTSPTFTSLAVGTEVKADLSSYSSYYPTKRKFYSIKTILERFLVEPSLEMTAVTKQFFSSYRTFRKHFNGGLQWIMKQPSDLNLGYWKQQDYVKIGQTLNLKTVPANCDVSLADAVALLKRARHKELTSYDYGILRWELTCPKDEDEIHAICLLKAGHHLPDSDVLAVTGELERLELLAEDLKTKYHVNFTVDENKTYYFV